MPFPLPLLRPPGSPRLLIMVTIGSLLPSPWRQPRSPSFPPMVVTSRPRCFRLWARAEREGVQGETPPPPLPPPSSEKKSFAVATGELFLGLASLLLRRAPGSPPPSLLTAEQKVVVSKEGVDEEVLYFSDRGEDVATAVEDRVDQEVIWEQRPEDVEAEKKRKKVTSPGFSFSAAGLLFPYHLGVAQLLLEKGYITETTPLSGSSAGAIVCVVIASGNTMQDALKAMKLLAEDCRTNGTAFRLGAVLRDVLQELLPDDVHVRSNGSVRVAVTQLLWRPRGLLVDQFDSKEDLINAVFTSSFIPGYLAPRPATIFRNRLCIDGGLTLFMPPTSASETVIQATATDNYGLVEALVSHMCDIDQKQLVLYAQMANLVNLVLPAMEINIKEVTEIFSKLACNAHTICDSELRPLGTGLYPIISIINHSCLPNSALLFEGRRAVVRSVEPIVEGTEISISYIDTASSTKKRQKDLNEQYFFTCACPRCKKANYYEDANENESALEGYRCMDRKCSGFLVFDSQEKKFTCQQCALSRDHQAIKRIEKELKDLADKASKSLSSCCYSEASVLYMKIEELQVELFHSHSLDLLKTRENLLKIYTELKDWNKALEYCRLTIPIYERLYPEVHPLRGLQYYTCGRLEWLLEHTEEALRLFTKAVDILRITHGTSTLFMKELLSQLEEAHAEASYKVSACG